MTTCHPTFMLEADQKKNIMSEELLSLRLFLLSNNLSLKCQNTKTIIPLSLYQKLPQALRLKPLLFSFGASILS